MEYTSILLKKEYDIKKIYTIFYFEFGKDYNFLGESHDFWEIVYVDKGEITVTADGKKLLLKQGNAVFHMPGEYHTFAANGTIAPNIIIVSFECRSKAMDFYKNKTVHLSDAEKTLLKTILAESKNAFNQQSDTYGNFCLSKKSEAVFGSEQLIALLLMQLLISIRRNENASPAKPVSMLVKNQSTDIADTVTAYLKKNIDKKLTFSDITAFAGISASGLKSIFRRRYKTGVMTYFRQLKIKRAKSRKIVF